MTKDFATDEALTETPDAYLSLRALSLYGGLSVRLLRSLLTHPVHPLPHYRVGAKILVKRSEFDIWIRHHRETRRDRVEQLVTTLLQSL